MIDSSAGRPAHKQLADILRHRIESGSFIQGEMLPSAATYRRRDAALGGDTAQTHAAGTDTVRRALTVLRPAG